MKTFFYKIAGLVAALGPISLLSASVENPPLGVIVRVWATGNTTATGSISLDGDCFLPETPGDSNLDKDDVQPTTGTGSATATLLAPVRVQPGVTYLLSVGGTNLDTGFVHIVAPAGFQVFIDSIAQTQKAFFGAWSYRFQVQRVMGARSMPVGAASTVAPLSLDWTASVGNQLNGSSAGGVEWVDTGAAADWSTLFTPALLNFETDSSEVAIYRPDGVLRQISANQATIDIIPDNALHPTYYDISFYNPSQMSPGSDPRLPVPGQMPFASYRVQPGSTGNVAVFTKALREGLTNATADRTETMTSTRTGTWPLITWTQSPWTVLDSLGARTTPVSKTAVSDTNSGTTRTETLNQTPDGGGTSALALTRTYDTLTGVGEVVTSESAGSSLTTTFDYYNTTTNPGSLGQVKSVAFPAGWETFDYYEPTTSDPHGGQIKTRYRPYVNSPSTPGYSASSGEVTSFEYTTDFSGAFTRPSLIQTNVNGTMTAKTTYTYTDIAIYANGQTVARTTRTDYTAATNTLVSESCIYRPDYGETFTRGQLYSVTGPDGVRKVYAYEQGTWSSPTFTAVSGGTASRVSVITGSTNSGAGTQITSYNGKTIDTVYLIAGKSTMETTIRDERALAVRVETAMCTTGSSFQTTGWTTSAYDFAGRLTSQVSSKGNLTVYSATYANGHKTSETDAQGVVLSYTYDNGGRIVTVTRSGVTGTPLIGPLITQYTFDAAGHKTVEAIGDGSTLPIKTQMTYDSAGRLTSETPPGLGVTTHSYNVTSRTHTATRPDSSTIIETVNLDGVVASKTGTAVVNEFYTYGVDSGGKGYFQVNLGTSSSLRTIKKTSDWLGRWVKIEKPIFGGGTTLNTEEAFYDTSGRVQKTTKTGRNPVRYTYNALSQLLQFGLDVNNNEALDTASDDRIRETETYLESISGSYWLRRDTRVYAASGSSTFTLTGISRTRLTGLSTNQFSEVQTVDGDNKVTDELVEVNTAAKTATLTETRTGITGSKVTNFSNGLPWKVTNYDGLVTTMGYDSHLRANTVTNSRAKTTTKTFVITTDSSTPRIATVQDPSGAYVSYGYDNNGRTNLQLDQRNHYTRYSYSARDELVHQWGDGAMPVEYSYSAFGDRTTMTTFRGGTGWDTNVGDNSNSANPWPSSPGTPDTTTWAYDEASGLLGSKTDAAGQAVTQTYSSFDKVASKTWARGVTITYGYGAATGDLLTVSYSDSTPGITYAYTRLGQIDSVVDATGTRDLIYNSTKPWQLSAEAMDTFYGSKVLTRLYEASGMPGRNDGFKLGSTTGSNSDLEQDYGYTRAGRFETLMSGRSSNASTRTFRYGYKSDAPLVNALSIDGSHPFTVTRTYDADRDLVVGIESKWSTASRTNYTFTYDERGDRTSLVQSGDVFADYGDSTHRIFTYDGRNQVTSDVGYMNSTATSTTDPLPGRHYGFAHDNAGNRAWSDRTGVDTTPMDGLPDLRDTYTTNAVNQYTTRENNTVPVSGTANTDSNVAVQGRTVPAGRKGRYWNDETVVNNLNHPWYGTLSIFTAKPGGGGGGSDLYRVDTRTAQLAQVLQTFTYDNDGNMTGDGIWTYTWDAENRLIRMVTTTTAATYGFPNQELDFKYDYLNRRVEKHVINLTTSTDLSYRRFLYDGSNLIAEYDYASSTLTLKRSYTWGLDIVDSRATSGGVGALLQIADHASGNTYLAAYDGNGNIAALLNASSGAAAAIYEYSPFGEPLRAQVNDSTLADQPFRFSTKFTDLETGMVNYGRRYYSPSQGRFLGRDPIEEKGGLNLYAFCRNNAVNKWDFLGLDYFDYVDKMDAQFFSDNVQVADNPGSGNSANVPAFDATFAPTNTSLLPTNSTPTPSSTDTNGPIPFVTDTSLLATNPDTTPSFFLPDGASNVAPNNTSSTNSVQWVIDQTRAQGYGSLADKLQTKLDNGSIQIDKSLSGTDVAGQVNMFSTTVNLNPDYAGQNQLFANTVVHEYVHTVQNSTIGSALFTGGARATSDVQAFFSATESWIAGNGFNYSDKAYDLDLAEQQARTLSDLVFPPDWKP